MKRSLIGRAAGARTAGLRTAMIVLVSAWLAGCAGQVPVIGPDVQQQAALPRQSQSQPPIQPQDYAQRLAVARAQCIARRDGLSISQARAFCGCLYDGFLAEFTWSEVERLQQEFRRTGLGLGEQAELMKRNPKFALLTRRCASGMNDIAV